MASRQGVEMKVALMSAADYLPGSKCRIYPWAHARRAMTGIIVVPDATPADLAPQPYLIYMSVDDSAYEQPTPHVRFHKATIELDKGRIRLVSNPDPETDEEIADFRN